MLKNRLLGTFLFAILLGFTSCNENKTNAENLEVAKQENKALISEVMTKDAQTTLTPEEALEDLMQGNQRYVSGNLNHRDLQAQIHATTDGQFPKAVVLACIDSRVPVEYIFDQGIGDMFVARVAGNVEDKDLLGSLEYGLAVAGSKVLVVMGHQNCGAVKSAVKKVDVGSDNVTTLLNEIEPAIAKTEGERDAKDKTFMENVTKNNVTETIKDIRERSSIISGLEKEGKIKIVGAYYSLKDGKVELLD